MSIIINIKRLLGWWICKRNHMVYSSLPLMGVRMKILNNLRGGIVLGKSVSFSNDTYLLNVTNEARIVFGNHIRIAHHFQISCAQHVIIASHVNIAPFVFITDHNHAFENIKVPIMEQGIRIKKGDKVLIDEGTWIGTKVTIIGNVRIGKNCVIGSNSVVTKDIPDYSVAAGIPCKVIKRYDFEQEKWVRV